MQPYYHQPDCNIGWDSHRDRYYFGYDLYTLTASDSENDLPVIPFLGPASRHDSHGFLYNWFSMQQYLPDVHVTKLLLDSAHDAMAYLNTAVIMVSDRLLTSTTNADVLWFTKMILPSIMTVSLFVRKDYGCVGTVQKPQRAVQNANVVGSA